jgi:hypothetical protein
MHSICYIQSTSVSISYLGIWYALFTMHVSMSLVGMLCADPKLRSPPSRQGARDERVRFSALFLLSKGTVNLADG